MRQIPPRSADSDTPSTTLDSAGRGLEAGGSGDSIGELEAGLPEAAGLPEEGGLRRAGLRFGLFIALILGLAVALRWTPLADYADQELLVSTIESSREELRRSWWAVPALLGLYAVLCPLGSPVSLLWIAGGLVFGVAAGSAYNLVGSVLGAAVSYYLARSLGQDFVDKLTRGRLKGVKSSFNRRGFWPLASARLLPIPFPIFNYAAALVGIRPSVFLLSSTLGLIAPVIVWTWFWHTAYAAAAGDSSQSPAKVVLALLALFVVMFAPRLWVGLQRKRRYREILAWRRGKADDDPARCG